MEAIHMTTADHWSVEIELRGDERETTAEARLTAVEAGDIKGRLGDLRGAGRARRNPRDESVPQIGEELAAARALSDLAHRLLDAAAHDIERYTHEPANLSG
jgi:hypothetical protein